jgi:hypothetical protein
MSDPSNSLVIFLDGVGAAHFNRLQKSVVRAFSSWSGIFAIFDPSSAIDLKHTAPE